MVTGRAQGDALEDRVLDGRYRLGELIGRGGMASVHHATDTVLHRPVAVKLFGESTDEAHSIRAAQEVRVLAALNHPSLVTLYDARVDAGHDAYLVMELVDGPTLHDRIARGPIAPVDVAAMAVDLCDALHAVHTAGMVHRDVKPSNVLLAPSVPPNREFRAKLADFGIAHLVDSARLTTPGTIMGTAAYLSPEQTRGVSPAPAGDVYSLGLVLLESLTRTRAFPGTLAESLVARVQRDPAVPGDIGYAWKSLLTAMTAREPANRPTAMEAATVAREILLAEGTGGVLVDDTALVAPVVGIPSPAQATMQAQPQPQTETQTQIHAPTQAPAQTPTEALTPTQTQAWAQTETETQAFPGIVAASSRAARRASAAPRRPRRSRLLVGVAVATLMIGLGSGLTTWLLQSRAPATASPTMTSLSSLTSSIDALSAGVTTLVSESRAAANTDAVPVTDDTTDESTDASTSDPDVADPAAPAPTEPTTPIEPNTPTEPTTPSQPAAPETTAPDEQAPGNSGNGNGNGNGPGNNSGNGNGNGNSPTG